jgi:hypothetical protein
MINTVQFEELISSTIEETKDIPEIISETGKIGMPHKGSSGYHLECTGNYNGLRHYATNRATIPAQD